MHKFQEFYVFDSGRVEHNGLLIYCVWCVHKHLCQGAMRNCVLAIQREVLEGDLLRGALRLGPTDLDGLVRMVKDVLQRYFAPGRPGQQEDDL